MTDDRRGKARPGHSYKDPVYDGYEAEWETKYGLPRGGMRAIRTRGEKSNSDQVSPVGASTVYQIMPDTRNKFLKKYGVDAFASQRDAAHVAALHLRDDLRRTGSWEGAVRGYIGGPDPSRHGKVTAAYVARVTGAGTARDTKVPTGPGASVPYVPALKDWSIEDILSTSPDQLGNTRRGVGPQRRDPASAPAAKRAQKVAALTGGSGIAIASASDPTRDISVEQRAYAGAKGAIESAEDRQARGGVMSEIGAAVDNTWFLPALMRSFDQTNHEGDTDWHRQYMKNWQVLEEHAESQAEVNSYREAGSLEEYTSIKADWSRKRQNAQVLTDGGSPTAMQIGAALVDPAGWVAGLGVGKVAQLAKVGSAALAAEGRALAAATSVAGEGAVGNVALTAAFDMAGEHTTVEDYAISGLTGLAIGAAMSPFVAHSAGSSSLIAGVKKSRSEAIKAKSDRYVAATAKLGPDATPEAVQAEVQRSSAAEVRDWLTVSLADVPDDLRLLHEDPDMLLTSDPAKKADVELRHNLSSIADEAERGMVAEHLARAEAILAANPIDPKALKTVLSTAGMESTGLRLLASESPVAKAVGAVLLEGTTGAAGRRRTAAMSKAVRERIYNKDMANYDGLYHTFRKGQGAGLISEAYSGTVRRDFNRRVFAEVEARGNGAAYVADTDFAVVEAADLWERGMTAMRVEQQHVNTVGAARLGDDSRGYMTHRIDPAKIVALTARQQTKVREVLSAQFVDPRNGFDKAFSDKLAVKYLEKATERARGGYDVPVNLHSPEAADIVRNSLEAMNLPRDDVEALMGKFSRGGATHTKRRLKLDLSDDIGDGMKLMDLFNTDVPSLYRSYARRVAGEVALAQYGIMGNKGLKVLRKAIQSSGGSVDDLKAFDQIAAEFLNTPFGDWNHKNMDNLRVATSLSRLGGMGFTQFAEYANGIASVGVMRSFSAIGALPRMVKEVTQLTHGGVPANPILASLDTLGGNLGLDEYALTRMFDVKDNDIELFNTESLGVGTRALRAAGHIQASLSGHRMIMAVQVRGMAEQIVRKAVGYARSGTDDIALADMGFTPELQAALRREMDNVATFDGDQLDTLDLLKGKLSPQEIMGIRDAVERGASQIIQRTYTGETGKWAHNGFLKMLFQFRTFSLTSVEKQWGRNMKNYGALKSAMYLAGAMSLAVPIHLARVNLKTAGMSRSERQKYAEEHTSPQALARATLNYASASGLLGDVLDIGGGFASSLGGDIGGDMASFVGARGQGRGQLVGGVVAPGVGLLQDVWTGVHGDAHKLMKAMPGSNLPYVAPIINAIEAE